MFFFSVADFVSAAMTTQSEHDDPDTWSLPSEGVKHGAATPTVIGLEDATPKEIQLDTEEIEAELLRGVSLRIALSGFGLSDVILLHPSFDVFQLYICFHFCLLLLGFVPKKAQQASSGKHWKLPSLTSMYEIQQNCAFDLSFQAVRFHHFLSHDWQLGLQSLAFMTLHESSLRLFLGASGKVVSCQLYSSNTTGPNVVNKAGAYEQSNCFRV